jgi:hypothetical protein
VSETPTGICTTEDLNAANKVKFAYFEAKEPSDQAKEAGDQAKEPSDKAK